MMSKRNLPSQRVSAMLVWCASIGLLYTCIPAYADPGTAIAVGASLTDTSATSASSSVIRMIGGLFLCLGVFAAVVRLLRRNALASKGHRRLQVREKVALSAKASLQLVAVDNREFLVSSTADHISIVPLHSITTELFADSLEALNSDDEARHA
jgi:flagellar biogenesis protein FliO